MADTDDSPSPAPPPVVKDARGDDGLDLVEILLIEDDDGDAVLTMELLRRDHLANTVTRVVDGEAALALLESGDYQPDVILLDLHLPNMSGHDVLKRIRASETHCLTPVVILTSSISDQDIAQSYEMHANCYIQKPIDFDEFRRVVGAIEHFWLAVVKRPPHL